MSVPRNHHYVSKTHLKKFYNSLEHKIYVYDKNLKNHYSKSTTKTLFSEDDLNTKFIDGRKDYYEVENELNEYFEKDFTKNVSVIQKFIENKKYDILVENSLIYFAKYGIIGDFRTPRYKKEIDDLMWGNIGGLIPICAPELKKGIERMFAYRNEVKYSNDGNYAGVSEIILQSMGNLIFKIIIPEKDEDFFIVPDCSSFTMRAKINRYFNPDIEEIACIGVPLTSKIYIYYFSEKLFNEDKPLSEIIIENSFNIDKINKSSLDICDSKVACENESYLKKFITN